MLDRTLRVLVSGGAGDREGLLAWLILPVAAGEEWTTGRHSREGPGAVGDAVEALRMLVRTATSFSASTLHTAGVDRKDGLSKGA
jgi:hypothetical protein